MKLFFMKTFKLSGLLLHKLKTLSDIIDSDNTNL